MKKHMLIGILIMLIALPTMIFAADEEDSKIEITPTIQMNMTGGGEGNQIRVELRKELKGLGDFDIPGMTEDAPDAPFMGLFIEDLDFPKAQNLGYGEVFGVLITGVVSNSPARDARLMEDDVVQYIGTAKIDNKAKFDKIKNSYRAGEKAVLTVWRSGEALEIDFTFGSRENKVAPTPTEEPKKKKLSVGYGGGTWIPMWFKPDTKDVDELMTGLGFEKLPENGLVMNGIGGKFNVGKGWFLGGQVTGWTDNGKRTNSADAEYKDKWMIDAVMGGVTLDKRFALAKWLTFSIGTMIGGGSYNINLLHTNSDFQWPDSTNAFYSNGNQNVSFYRNYMLVQPRSEVMVRILPWLGIRGEAGYAYGYSLSNGWKVTQGNEMEPEDLKGSPETPFQGLTVSIGPWFGF